MLHPFLNYPSLIVSAERKIGFTSYTAVFAKQMYRWVRTGITGHTAYTRVSSAPGAVRLFEQKFTVNRDKATIIRNKATSRMAGLMNFVV